jgi:ubiquinone/menaquinone biosynthesis C-methylase UbiE
VNKSFPNWDELYKSQDVELMPWYNQKLDVDLEAALEEYGITRGRFLDLGTGPATQALELAKRGFNVTGSDISENAIKKANESFRNKNPKIKLIKDDILNTRFKENEFDFIFDRGCFHVLPIEKRKTYVNTIKRILDEKGMLFIKCFSEKETFKDGPFRFSKIQIKEIFEESFIIENIKDTVYQGTLNPLPKSLFALMRKK